MDRCLRTPEILIDSRFGRVTNPYSAASCHQGHRQRKENHGVTVVIPDGDGNKKEATSTSRVESFSTLLQ